MSAVPFTRLFIDGEWRPASTGATFDVVNPATSKVVGTSASASADDCVAAIEAAGRAFRTWEHSPLPVRRDVFLRAADLLATEKYKQKVAVATKEELASGADMFLMNHTVQINHLRNFKRYSRTKVCCQKWHWMYTRGRGNASDIFMRW